MNSENEMVSLVRGLNNMISQYGMTEVQHALKFIVTYPVGKVAFSDGFGNTWMISVPDVERITRDYANGNGKIQAIKLFRDITSCGLKEAKDAIEKYFKWERPSNW